MIKYAIVPQEPSCQMCASGSLAGTVPVEIYANMLAARPPLDAEMLAALELANDWATCAFGKSCDPSKEDVQILARALRRANGEDV